MKGLLFVLSIIFSFLSCKENNPKSERLSPTSDPEDTTNTTANISSLKRSKQDKIGDLEILDIKLAKKINCEGKYEFIATIRNNGPDDLHFEAGSNWKCKNEKPFAGSGTTISAYLGAGETHIYRICSGQLCNSDSGFWDLPWTIGVDRDGYREKDTSNNKKIFHFTVPIK